MIDNRVLIGKRICELRTDAHMTQAKLAEIAGFSPQYICQIETGRKNISLSALLMISNVLGITIDELLYGVQPSRKHDYVDDINLLLQDCNSYEKRVIYEVIRSLRDSLKNNRSLIKSEKNDEV